MASPSSSNVDNETDVEQPQNNSSNGLFKGTFSQSPKDAMSWIQTQIASGISSRDILQHLIPDINIPEHYDELSLWRAVFEILSEPPPREKLKNFNTIDDVKMLIEECKNIIILTGAGVSVSCGIPDFRSRDGIYARLSQDYPDLPNPTAMFDIHYFRRNPHPFFKFAKEIYPGQFAPSLCHRFIAYLDSKGKLLRNYTQNIDTLEQVAGISNVIQCHGSFATATCMNCKVKVDSSEIKADIFDQKIPYCKVCKVNDDSQSNILKPDIVFFGESLPEHFHQQIEKDKDKADLLIVIGSSLKVRPVSLIPDLIKPDVPQILINRETLGHRSEFDIELLGNCDDIICELCTQLNNDYTSILNGFVRKPLSHSAITSIQYSKQSKEHSNNVDANSACPSIKDSDIDANSACSNKTENGGSSSSIQTQELCAEIQTNEPETYYIHIPPCRYIFHGAELSVYDNNYTDNDSEQSEADVNPKQVESSANL